MSDVEELLADPNPDPVRIVRILAQLADAARRHEQRLDNLYERLLLVDELPDSAPFGAILRLTSGGIAVRAPLYLGNGPNQPLSKLVPEPLS